MPSFCVLVAGMLATACCRWQVALPAVIGSFWILRAIRGDTRWWRLPVPVLAVGLALGAWVAWCGAATGAVPAAGRHRVEGTVRRSQCGDERCVAELDVLRAEPVSGGGAFGGTRVRAWSSHAWVPGERVRAWMGLGPPVAFRNPGMEATFAPRGLPSGGAAAVQVRVASPWRRAFEGLRARVRRRLVRHTKPEAAAIARALVLGESAALDERQRSLVRGAGLAHLVAVSGLHMALFAGMWARVAAWLARWLGLCARWPARRVGAAAGLGMLLPTVLFVGAAPSALRAGLTAGLGGLAVLLGRRPDAVAVACTATTLCLALDPGLGQRPGFLLSIAATAALLKPGRSDLEPVTALRPGLAGLRDSGRTWLATLPFGLAAFGTASPWALISNLLAVPFATLLWVPLALLHAVAVSIHPWLSGLTAPAFELSCELLIGFASLLPALPGVDEGVHVGPWSFALLCCAAGVGLWGGARRARWVRALAVAGCLVLAVAVQRIAHAAPAPGELEVTYLDVGQGDAAVVREGSGAVALIDVGGRLHGRGPDPGARSVVPWLRAQGITRLDLVVLSHPHPDHVGGLPAVMGAFPINEIWDTGQAEDEHPDGALAGWLAEARRAGTRVRSPGDLCGEPQRLGSARLEVWAPCPAHDPGRGPNDNSFVLLLQHGRRRFLFPGDAERAQEAGLVAAGGLPHVDVLKVGHHGSRTSSHAPFLAALAPRLAVISCGRHNGFGHPHAAALGRLKRSSARVLRIDELGGVQVHSDGRELRVRAFDDAVDLTLSGDGPPGLPSASR